MKSIITPRELARAIGVSESSMKRWADDGLVRATRTAGGHRRITVAEAVRFIRQIGATVVQPDILGLPELSAIPKEPTQKNPTDALHRALEAGDARLARGLVQSMYLGGMSVADICDGPVRESMVRIGELWLHQEWGIAVEHRATDLCIQAINQLRFLQAPGSETAPVALGGAAEHDPYILPSLMAATVAAEAGLRDVNLGPRTPASVLYNAALHYRARMLWVTISVAAEPERSLHELHDLAGKLGSRGVTIVAGGRGLAALPGADLRGVILCRSMNDLLTAARDIMRADAAAARDGPPGEPGETGIAPAPGAGL